MIPAATKHSNSNKEPTSSSSSSTTTTTTSSSSSRNEYHLGGTIARLLQDHHTMSTKSVWNSQYMVTHQHWMMGQQIKHSTLSDCIRERWLE